jgi:hypothetical protein
VLQNFILLQTEQVISFCANAVITAEKVGGRKINCSASGKRCCKKVSAVCPGSSISCMGKYGGNKENSKGLIIITFIILVLQGRSFIYYYFVNSYDRSTIFLRKTADKKPKATYV